MTITIIPVTWFKKIGDKLFPKSIKKIFGLNEISTEYINSSRSIISPILKSDSQLANINGLMVYSLENEFIDLVAGDKQWRGITEKDGVLYACVYGGSIWQFTNSGVTCTDLETGNKNWRGITEKDGVLYACVSEGSIWKSINDGVTWTDLETGNKSWIFISSTDTYLFAIDSLGVLYRSSDGFVTFEEITTGFLNNITTIRQVNNYLLAGNGDKIMKSTDDGITWSELSTLPDSPTIQDIIASKYTYVIYAYDQSGKIYYSVDGGVNWLEKDTGTDLITKYYGVANNEYIYICAEQIGVGTILRAKMYNFVGNDNGSTIFYGKHEIAKASDEDSFENGLYISEETGRLTLNQDGSLFDASVPQATASNDGKILGVSGSAYAFVTAFSNIKIEADDETSKTIGNGETVYLLGGTGIDTESDSEVNGSFNISINETYLDNKLSKYVGTNLITASSYTITATSFGKLVFLNNDDTGVLVDLPAPSSINYQLGQVISFLDISTIESELTCATGVVILSRDNAYTSAGEGAFFSAIAVSPTTWALSGDLIE
jgi:hypothetical protein